MTREQAVDYVRYTEASWQLVCIIVDVKAGFEDEIPVFNIQTADNAWTVWEEPTGRIYGEC